MSPGFVATGLPWASCTSHSPLTCRGPSGNSFTVTDIVRLLSVFCVLILGDAPELLERTDLARRRLAAAAGGVGDLADVHVAARVGDDRVGRSELAGLPAEGRAAES